jgi:serine/threonine-protein kinase
MAARRSFEAAVAADPGFAAAHLRLLIFSSATQLRAVAARRHFQVAREHRASLSERDRALLDALDPALAPADAASRFRSLAALYPGDAEIAFQSGSVHEAAGAVVDSLAEYDRALAVDPAFAEAIWAKARMLLVHGDDARALALLDRCLAISPGAASCLRVRAMTEEQAGDCERMEADARRMVEVEPEGYRPYEFLARALAARGAGRPALEQALRQKWAAADDPHRELWRRLDQADLDLIEGDFAHAESIEREAARTLADDPSERAHAVTARRLADIELEIGRPERAAADAEAFYRAAPALTPDGTDDAIFVQMDPVPSLLALLRRAGRLSADEHRAAVDRWQARFPPTFPRGPLWRPLYANACETAEEAHAALAALSQYAPLPAPSYDSADLARDGRAHLLAGEAREARALLDRGTRACVLLDEPIAMTRALLDLGAAAEATGDRDAACRAYAAVLARWGRARPRSVTADAARARSQALRCP